MRREGGHPGLAVAAGVCVLAAACGGSGEKHGVACNEPGTSEPCTCSGQPFGGTRTCQEDGYWSDCDCDTPYEESNAGTGGAETGGASGDGVGGATGDSEGGTDAAGGTSGTTAVAESGGSGLTAGSAGIAGAAGSAGIAGAAGNAAIAGDAGSGGVQAAAGWAGSPNGAGMAGVSGNAGNAGGTALAGTAGAAAAAGAAGREVGAGNAGTDAAGGLGGAAAAGGNAGTAGTCSATVCGSECVDLNTNVDHCGDCGFACSAANAQSVACVAGVCSPTCEAGYGDCTSPVAPDDDDGCETNLNDASACGTTCENTRPCAVNAVSVPSCSEGRCDSTCIPGWSNCTQPAAPDEDDGCETNTAADTLNCGACGHRCPTGECLNGFCQCGSEGASCNGMTGTECDGESCCAALFVPGGTYDRAGDPAYPATVADMCVDKYEVTVGRFREFLDDYESWIGAGGPADGDGAHPLIAGSGWDSAWNAYLPTTGYAVSVGDGSLEDHLRCRTDSQTWHHDVGTADQERYPVNCVNWYEAFAFCIWDGGRLLTDAEWEYVAGGGSENRLYAWGDDATEPLPADYSGNHGTPFLAVGSEPDGNGRWGHADLTGSLWEWVLDWYIDPYSPAYCYNCANLSVGAHRTIRGGGWRYSAPYVVVDYRYRNYPGYDMGIRCARSAM